MLLRVIDEGTTAIFQLHRTTKSPAMPLYVEGGIITEGLHLLFADSSVVASMTPEPHYTPLPARVHSQTDLKRDALLARTRGFCLLHAWS